MFVVTSIYLINSAIYKSVIFLYDHLEEVGSKLLTPGSATNQRLMSPAMATKKAEKLAPQLLCGAVKDYVKDMVIKEVATGTRQPEHRHAKVVVEYHADNRRNQVPSMGGGGRSTTSPQESDNNRQAQSRKGCCTSSSRLPDNVRQVRTKQRCVTTGPQKSENHRQAQSKHKGATTDPQLEANGTKIATEEESAMNKQLNSAISKSVIFL